MDLNDFKIEVCSIDSVLPHPNADRLSIYRVKGWQVVGGKDTYKVGDKVVYIPVDSILPSELENKLFPEGSKIKLIKSRVRAIKIRQFISQGMLVSLETFDLFPAATPVGTDITEKSGIKKYEPPTPSFQKGQQSSPASKKKQNPYFQVYSKFPRIQNAFNIINSEEKIVVTEKIHGTNFRAGWVPFVGNTLWKKFLKLIRLSPKWQFVYGSHYVQLSDKLLYNGYYDKNVYAEIVHRYDLKNRLQKGDVIYGEIYGAGIQKGYDYGLKDTRDLVVFDIQRNGSYLDYCDFVEVSDNYGFKRTPELYIGRYLDCPIKNLTEGSSIIDPNTKVREGCVIKLTKEKNILPRIGIKSINPEYLLKDTTDYH